MILHGRKTMIKKILNKAVEGGLKLPYKDFEVWEDGTIVFIDNEGNLDIGKMFHFDHIIFSHDFLRAFFGDREVCRFCGNRMICSSKCLRQESDEFINFNTRMLEWQYHAQQLVLSEDRIKYLEKYVK